MKNRAILAAKRGSDGLSAPSGVAFLSLLASFIVYDCTAMSASQNIPCAPAAEPGEPCSERFGSRPAARILCDALSGRCHVVCHNPDQAHKDAATRKAIVERLHKMLEQPWGPRSLVSNRSFQRYLRAKDSKSTLAASRQKRILPGASGSCTPISQ